MKARILSLLFASALILTSCSSAKEQLGITKKAPDEFAVVKHAPLAMPPDYGLRPPRPGAPRPQEQSPEQQAKQTVFGAESGDVAAQPISSGPDSALLSKAGAGQTDPSIRQKVDAESKDIGTKNKPVVKKLLGLAGAGGDEEAASVVNAKEEAERLRKNQETGKPVTDGETPSVEE